jgi:hypothetical protein
MLWATPTPGKHSFLILERHRDFPGANNSPACASHCLPRLGALHLGR